ncbi:hypothetical protein M902_2977 [Bacteriovorax sp. BAL6_X]|uniref:hypothetical protein n=1 Tax=Bacteriovorax sp. BAL6_X TaxID=1201290 RepID=UPI0003863C22|nr:hypothetical protein [Bacteriovorax sp. BAL6_X]EPZ51294.1 hypothetical protein M902_2977 [Bacteriovorax sp. BAL6_X]
MKKIILTLLLSFVFMGMSLSTYANSTARFGLEIEMTNVMTNEVVITAECEVTQVLEWRNGINVFNCIANDKKILMKNVSNGLGYDYTKSSAFTHYFLDSSKGIAAQLFLNLGLDYEIENAGTLEVVYRNDGPEVVSNDTIVETNSDVLLFSVTKIEYL